MFFFMRYLKSSTSSGASCSPAHILHRFESFAERLLELSGVPHILQFSAIPWPGSLSIVPRMAWLYTPGLVIFYPREK